MRNAPLFPGDVANFRDLAGTPAAGGRTVRPHRLLRSSALVAPAPHTADALVSLLGPAVYADLRTDREIDRDGAPEALVERGWRWLRIPVQDLPDDRTRRETAADRYRRSMPACLRAAESVAAELVGGPVVVACSLGKDRTGTVVALLLRWLGVPPEHIASDHELSNEWLARDRALLPQRWRDGGEIGRVRGADCLAAIDLAAPPRPGVGEEHAPLRSALLR
ncbi:tyrosine-protein phosphatase [Streptomyces sp. WZ.A104]|uniref:tyrosine-protein phosphatase n=1 Tax=Streptomyces sp. WZ.A104 TaxID=2023771 RepID=UPI0015CE2436|nr:tyrosine-protein phosphatase [Streptomyces sp. WZ.A104]